MYVDYGELIAAGGVRRHFKQVHPIEPQSLTIQDSALTERGISVLSSHFYGRVTLPKISRKLAFSPSHLKKKFKHCTARDVIKYYNHLIISEAKRHISLTSRFTDYLYIPLGGSRRVLKGRGAGILAPWGKATRAETAALLARFFDQRETAAPSSPSPRLSSPSPTPSTT